MKKRKIILFDVLLVATLAYRFLSPDTQATETPVVYAEARTYENEVFSFTIPDGWRTMGSGRDYYGLGVQEIITIQSPSHRFPTPFLRWLHPHWLVGLISSPVLHRLMSWQYLGSRKYRKRFLNVARYQVMKFTIGVRGVRLGGSFAVSLSFIKSKYTDHQRVSMYFDRSKNP